LNKLLVVTVRDGPGEFVRTLHFVQRFSIACRNSMSSMYFNMNSVLGPLPNSFNPDTAGVVSNTNSAA
jgi:hypothetical protein